VSVSTTQAAGPADAHAPHHTVCRQKKAEKVH
jgi:hypothetical protein